jgi:hypothetical protein
MTKQKSRIVDKAKHLSNQLYTGAIIATVSYPTFAVDTEIDLVTAGGLAGVAVVGGLMAAGGLKALPTYVGWGIKKALSMLR